MHTLPPGAIFPPDFVTAAEEEALLRALDGGMWSRELKRRVQHFGYRYDYRARKVTAEARLGPLPGWLAPLGRRLAAETPFRRMPDQAIANEYMPGQGIAAHVDCVPCFGGCVASLSLSSPCEMIFRAKDDALAFRLPPRSLIVLTGAARYDWTHEIPARKSDPVEGGRMPRGRRVSLTFRNVVLEKDGSVTPDA